jgi:DNA-binding CsgD family transcriptional regulator
MTKPQMAECLIEAGRVMALSLPDSPVAIAYLNDLTMYRCQSHRDPLPPLHGLTPRQREMVSMARALTDRQIAKKLWVSVGTVKKTLNDARKRK